MTVWQGLFSAIAAIILFLFSLQSFSHELQKAGGETLQATIGLTADTDWVVCYGSACDSILTGGFHGVATNSEKLMSMINYHPKSAAHLLMNLKLFKRAKPGSVGDGSYKYQHVYPSAFPELGGTVFIESKRITEGSLDAAWRVASHLA